MEGLMQLYLQKCREFTCEPIKAFVEDLESSSEGAVADLKLNGNSKRLFHRRVQPMQVFALCESLKDSPHVMVVDLSYNHLNDLAAQAVAGLIKANPRLAFLNLAGNSIGPEGARHLANALAAPGCQLQVLSLTGNAIGEEGVMAVAETLRVNTSLKALDLSDVQAGIKGLVAMCGALGAEGGQDVNTSLEVLDLGAPIIHMQQDTVILSLARMLHNNGCLRELGLSKHKMVDSQLETLVTYGLLRNTSLQSLDLHANRLSGFAGPQLERVLGECRSLASLNLQANMLGDTGARALAGCLPYSPWLTSLDLRSNNIGDQGLRSLAEALGASPHLRLLLLWGNSLGPAASRALMEALATAPQGVASQGGELVTDLRPYEVDGVAQVALLDHADTAQAATAAAEEQQPA